MWQLLWEGIHVWLGLRELAVIPIFICISLLLVVYLLQLFISFLLMAGQLLLWMKQAEYSILEDSRRILNFKTVKAFMWTMVGTGVFFVQRLGSSNNCAVCWQDSMKKQRVVDIPVHITDCTFLSRTVTVDEIRVHYYKLKSKRQSVEWLHWDLPAKM